MKFATALFLMFAFTANAAEVHFTFALPEVEGRITLGVFDAAGKLVRSLYSLSVLEDFAIDDNGLVARWDGKNDAGEELPAGPYFVRGFLIGDAAQAEGVAYHFNDWIKDEMSPRIAWLEDFQRLPDGTILGLAQDASGSRLVFRHGEEEGFLWAEKLQGRGDAVPALLAADEALGTVFSGSDYYHFSTTTGPTAGPIKFEKFLPQSMALYDGRLFLAMQEGLAEMPALPGGEIKTISAPEIFDALSVTGQALLGGSRNKSGIWMLVAGKWSELPVPACVNSLSQGMNGTIWLVGREAENEAGFAGQFASDGEFLRSYRGDLPPKKISSSRVSEEVTVLEQSAFAQRLIGLRLKTSGTGSEWETIFEKENIRCQNFGLQDGKLLPDAGGSPQTKELPFQTSTGGLSEKAEKIIVQAITDQAGCWLETSGGLRLLRVAEKTGLQRVVVEQGAGPGSMKVYAGDGSVVEEYLVTGLENVVALNVGEIDLP